MLLGQSENFKYMSRAECMQVDVYRMAKHIRDNLDQLKEKDVYVLVKGLGIAYLIQVKTLRLETNHLYKTLNGDYLWQKINKNQ